MHSQGWTVPRDGHILDPTILESDDPKAFHSLILHQDLLLHGTGGKQNYLSAAFQIHPYSLYNYLAPRSSTKQRPRTAEEPVHALC